MLHRLIPIASCAAVAAVLAGCTTVVPSPAVATVPSAVVTPAPAVIVR